MLTAGKGQGPAWELGSAQQLNQQIISRPRAEGLTSLSSPAVQPSLTLSSEHPSSPEALGSPGGRCCHGDGASGGVPGVSQAVSPGRIAVPVAAAAGELAQGRGEPSVPWLAARLFTSGQPDDSASLYYQLQKPGS